MEVDPGYGEMKGLAVALAITAATATSAETPAWKLTPAGWGPVRIGMNRDQVSNVLKAGLEGEAFDNEGSCLELIASNDTYPGMYFMFIDGKLTRVSVGEHSLVTTPRGIGIGSTAEEVRKAYGEKLQAETHHYDGPPAEYLTYWLKPEVRGVRFETDIHGKVQTIHAGNSTIQYIEGCA